MCPENVSLKMIRLVLLTAGLIVAGLAHPIPGRAQESATRQELLKQQRSDKAQKLHEEQRSGLEKAALYIQKDKVIERFSEGWKGFHTVLGGLATGSGFAGGLRYAPILKEGALEFELLGAISTRA